MISKKRILRHFSFCQDDAASGGACCLPSPPLVIMLLLPTAVYDDDDESAAVVNVAGGKVIEEFESIGMVYDAVVPQNGIALFKENPAIEFVESDAQVKIAQDTSIEYSEP
jgi:hypothetical protein